MQPPLSPTKLASKASMTRRELKSGNSFRSRATRRGIKNLPPTPSIRSSDASNNGGFEAGFERPFLDAGGDTKSNGDNEPEAFWVRVRASDVNDDSGYSYVPARVVEQVKGKKNTYRFEQISYNGSTELSSNGIFKADKSDIGPPIDLNDTSSDLPNMVDIVNVHESTILENLRRRYVRDEFMTAVGPILVVINPFKYHATKYGTDVIRRYHQDSSLGIESPHVYDLAERAYKNLGSERVTQAILISGESGAGKTETTKTCLRYLSEVAGADTGGGDIDAKLLSANPVLEAFGNAKTLRNDNSSRFGKWLEVHFLHDRLSICGCTTVSYLLEKTRVVGCGPGERSYHIFYQLLAGADDKLKQKLQIPMDAWSDYKTLSPSDGSSISEHHVALDAREFDVTTDAMSHLGFSTSAQTNMFRVLAGILSLGNIRFAADTSQGYAVIDSQEKNNQLFLNHASYCFGVDIVSLERALCVTTLVIAGESTDRRLLPNQASENRDALSKALYGAMFDNIIVCFNDAMSPKGTEKTLVVGILDIFGFEIFDNNSFEQLCINFANEKLQQHFNQAVFKEEIRACEEEGIVGVELKFTDNQDVLDLIEARGKRPKFGAKTTSIKPPPMGLLPMLDEEGRIVGGSDDGYLNKIKKIHSVNKRLSFKGPKGSGRTEQNEFWVSHYADHVKYDVTGFVDKNRDILQPDLETLMRSSKNGFISKTLFKIKEEEKTTETKKSSHRGKGTRTQKTQGGLFFLQLKSLMTILKTSTPHYIRCIKPNNLKQGRIFSPGMCNRQLACSGVYEAVRIRQQGFPHRFCHHEFIRRYWTVAPSILKNFDYSVKKNQESAVAKPYSQAIIAELERKVQGFAKSEGNPGLLLGRTRVLIPENKFTWLESYRSVIQQRAVYELQRVGRGFSARNFCRSLTKSRKLLRAAIAAGDVESAQNILQRVKQRTGKRVGFLLEQQQVQQLVDQSRQRQKLTEILETAKNQAKNKKLNDNYVSHFWENKNVLIEAHNYLTSEETGLTSAIDSVLSKSDRILLLTSKRALTIVTDMTKARDLLFSAMDAPTVAGLSRAIAQATEMESLHGKFCNDLLESAKVLLNTVTTQQMSDDNTQQAANLKKRRSLRSEAASMRRPPPMPVKKQISRNEQARAAGVDVKTYQAQVEGINAMCSMSTAIKNSWGRMNDDAKLKKLLLIEGLCESLRSSIFEDEKYQKWAQNRLHAVMKDIKTDQVKKGSKISRRNKSVNKAAQASARRRTGGIPQASMGGSKKSFAAPPPGLKAKR